jgi:hypothetical protein
MGQVLADPSAGIAPVLSTDSSTDHVVGSVPLPVNGFSVSLDLYVADPEGEQTGRTTGIPEFADGWVQGRQYLGTFMVDGAADQNAEPAVFDFPLSGLGAATGMRVTATANYTSASNTAPSLTITSPFSISVALQEGTGGPVEDIQITSITNSGGSVVLSWTGGRAPYTVERSSTLGSGALWTPAATASELTATVSNNSKTAFFRVRSSN